MVVELDGSLARRSSVSGEATRWRWGDDCVGRSQEPHCHDSVPWVGSAGKVTAVGGHGCGSRPVVTSSWSKRVVIDQRCWWFPPTGSFRKASPWSSGMFA